MRAVPWPIRTADQPERWPKSNQSAQQLCTPYILAKQLAEAKPMLPPQKSSGRFNWQRLLLSE